jgi:hypothetical protein
MSGSIFKKRWVNANVKWHNGDEYAFVYEVPNAASAQQIRNQVERTKIDEIGKTEILRLLKTREKVPLSEVSSLLTKYELPSTPADAQRLIESMISSGKIEGVFDGKDFVSRYALQRETVRYDIVSRFEVGKNGVVVLNCPNCGNPS